MDSCLFHPPGVVCVNCSHLYQANLYPSATAQSTSVAAPIQPQLNQPQLNQPPRELDARSQNLLDSLYPASSTTTTVQRHALREILFSSWYRRQSLEPNHELRQFIQVTESTGKYECTACHQLFDRRDRALNHFRGHIDHRPWACGGTAGCRVTRCTARFLTSEALKAHRSKKIIKCPLCGRKVISKNIPRHQESEQCRNAVAET